jgi:hypothetical protein
MPATTSRVSSEVKQMLAAGQISRFEEGSGVARTLHATCPDDGGRASVRRMSRELGGAVMEVTMRCPVCFNDFVAAPEALYLSGRASKSSAATKAPAPAAKKAAAKPTAKAPVKTTAKAAGKPATKSTAKTATKAASKAPARPAAKKAAKAAAKVTAKSSKTSTAKRPAAAKKSAAKKGSGRSGR